MDRAVPYVLVGLLALALVVVLAVVAVRGIGELDGGGGYGEWQEEPDQWAGAQVDPAFVYHEPTRFPGTPPPRAWFGLPRNVVELSAMDASRHPVARVRGYLAVGDAVMRGSLLDAVRAARDDGAPEDLLARGFGEMISGHPTPAHCGWLRERIAARDVPIRARFWLALTRCDDLASAALLLSQSDAPPEALEAFHAHHSWLAEEPGRALEDRIDDPTVSLPVLAATGWDEERAIRALVRCASADPASGGPGEWRSAECLRLLSEENPALAVRAARAIDRREPELGYLKELVHVLGANRSREDVVNALIDHAILPSGDVQTTEPPEALAARDILAHYGRAMCFETQPDAFPVGHDGLLVRLAWLVRPVLDDVVFDETPPYGGDYGYRIHAYATGTEHAVEARNLGGRYDTFAALGLLNVLLRDRYADARVARLEIPGTEIDCVVAGPERGLLAAERDGWLTLDDVPAM